MNKKIIVLLSTYNGEKFIKEQLDSLFKQTIKDIEVIVRDDGSTDRTCEILEEYSKAYNLSWHKGENIGFALSFMELLYNSPSADFYAFCDQDDIWHPKKIEIAISRIKELKEELPVMYTSNQIYIDEYGEEIGLRFKSPISTDFATRFFRGYLSGCTMVFNKVLRDMTILQKNRPSDEFIKMRWHDTWTLLICLTTGRVIYDSDSYIYYRRHSSNTSQTEITPLFRYINGLKSILFKNIERRGLRSKTAKTLLNLFEGEIIEENKRLLLQVSKYKNSWKSRMKLAFDWSIPLTKPESKVEFSLKVILGWL